ncbi:protein lethal(2)essential for life-like [Toxorhynchites rutilus septentrionalis]|uniref:protein lethal(2)essential for life-like n=1 Tax=Toxorhynchites rutilus septentrionalis TaxID=329112 RepID=UPI00247A4649|nr:protein lethal(2)essential for life-like [Toxorhynchites rutilus septentrionalis]
MPLVPILFRDWWDDSWDAPLRSSRILDQHFGSGISADDLLTALTTAAAAHAALQNRSRSGYNRPWHNASVASRKDAGSKVDVANDKFQINLDVQQFYPEEINVTANEKCITVEAKHEEKQDEHGYISRHFVRRYILPAGHNHNDIVSSLSSDGILTITAPRKTWPAAETRTIPVVKTGKPMEKLTEKSASKESETTSEDAE